MNIETQSIGLIRLGVEGYDEYLHIMAENATMWDDVHDWLLKRYYRDTTQEAGGYYIHRVTVMPRPNRDDEFIGIIHHRYDV